MTLSTPSGVLTQGILNVQSGATAPSSLVVPSNAPNAPLVANSVAVPIFKSAPTYITLNNSETSNPNCFPSAGSAPVQAVANITSGTIPYASAAFTGFSLSIPTAVAPSQSFMNLTLTASICAQSLNILTGGQTLSKIFFAWYTSQSSSNYIAGSTVGVAGSFYYNDATTLTFRIASSVLVGVTTLYLCAFFDSSWATGNMGVVVNGTITSGNVTAAITNQSISAYLNENVIASIYNPTPVA